MVLVEVAGGEISIADALGVAATSGAWGSVRITGVSKTEMLGDGALGEVVTVMGVNADIGVSGTRTTEAGAGVAGSGGGKREGAISSCRTFSLSNRTAVFFFPCVTYQSMSSAGINRLSS